MGQSLRRAQRWNHGPDCLERLVASYALEPQTAWYAVDASVWPRCDAETSPERGYYHHPYRQSHGQPIVAGWNSSWLVQLPLRCSSWTAPLRVRRIIPGENVNLVAAEQIRSWQKQALPSTALHRPPDLYLFTFDAGYEPIQLSQALADQQVGLLARLRRALLLRRPDLSTVDRTAAAAWRQVRL